MDLIESAAPLRLSKDTRKFFFEIGMFAASNRMKSEAARMFSELLKADPDAVYPRIGLGYCQVMSGLFKEGHQTLQHDIVAKSDMADLATCVRALGLQFEGRPEESKLLLKPFLENTGNSELHSLAKEILASPTAANASP